MSRKARGAPRALPRGAAQYGLPRVRQREPRLCGGVGGEAFVGHDACVILDSDALFLSEPELLGAAADVAVRPVDLKGSTTSEAGDEFEPYWQALCALAGVPIDILPFVETTIDRKRVRASYNGGYALVRRETGILERSAELFTQSVRADIRPYKSREGFRIFSSTGYVSERSSEYWGSNQAAFAVAAWSMTRRVRVLDARYNVPLHLLADPAYWAGQWAGIVPRPRHYHWMFGADHRPAALATLARIGVPADRLELDRGADAVMNPFRGSSEIANPHAMSAMP